MNGIKLFVSTLVVVFCLDMIWLGFIAKHLYFDSIGFLLRKSGDSLTPLWPAAIIVYFAIVAGILLFSLPRAADSMVMGLFWGGVLGLIIYGVYDFTNYAIIAKWPLNITLIDCMWGMVLCALTTCFAVFMRNWLVS